MPPLHSEITEIVTGLGTLFTDLDLALLSMPPELSYVSEETWQRLREAFGSQENRQLFASAFENGRALYEASSGLRHRRPLLVEWKGLHRPPGDDTVPADLRIDHVYLVSCKYLSKVLLNPGPARLFRGLLVGEERSAENWFSVAAPEAFQDFYDTTLDYLQDAHVTTDTLPAHPLDLTREQRQLLRDALRARTLPTEALRRSWQQLCNDVSSESARLWRSQLTSPGSHLRLLWRMLRIGSTSYFVLGSDRHSHLRLRVSSTWDWIQRFHLERLTISHRFAGQPEVTWRASIQERSTGLVADIDGHIEIRWSHGRFAGAPEAKVYLDSPLQRVPGYSVLT
jgi:hypothetical protein